ncbi:hypothetical protein M3M35_04280 [Fructilactobacillus myrtifloralis]|uniref:DUF4868 domain-containing protein n=1 Tax=Fructilactobacillus myrtifloralis TaxID=2940301 RepID=A0ABY5BLP3_9LACO|nr:hypothetical protein [Fructilactobacillus myrtifloralis]USS84542.1 hypothetical protein M3M35_04280 [Fructilactobacillus myrtifloralis]
MHYEVVNKIDVNHPSWSGQKKRLEATGGELITLAPNPTLRDQLNETQVTGFNVLDRVTGRTIDFDPNTYLYFNQLPTVTGAEIFMNSDFSVDVLADGNVIGNVILLPKLRRHVQQVDYLYENGDRDFTEVFASDGKKFSNEIYTNRQLQRIDFYDDQERPVVRFYYFGDRLNYITVENFKTMRMKAGYISMADFLAAEMKKIVKKQDTVGINFMGNEMWSLAKTKSHNTLYLEEDPFTTDGRIKQNLADILTDNIKFVQTVRMPAPYLEKIRVAGLPTKKIVTD